MQQKTSNYGTGDSSDGVKCDFDLNEKCEVCIKGKQTRAFFKEPGNRAESLLDIVHSDVMGSLRTKSFSGNRFILTFFDNYSRKVFVVPIKRKSNVFEEFKKIQNFCGEAKLKFSNR